MPMKFKTFNPAHALSHPLWWFALVVLMVNDHMLKYSTFAGTLTGKMSDVAGLIVAPVLLATLLRVRSARGLILSGLATGAVFSAINVSVEFAAIFDAWVSHIVPFRTTTDPTDLLALAAIPLGLRVFWSTMTRARVSLPALRFAGVGIGGLACMATSPPPCEDCEPEWEPQFTSQISILNRSNELHVLRIRQLEPNITLDCDIVRENPTAYLRSEYFGATTRWLLQSAQEIPVQLQEFGNAGCTAAMVESDTLPDILVFWDSGLPTKWYNFDSEFVPAEIPANQNTLTIEAEYDGEPLHQYAERSTCGANLDWCDEETYAPLAEIPEGARYSWGSVAEGRIFWPLPVLDTPTTTAGENCPMPGPGDGVFWTEPEVGALRGMMSAHVSDDGCAEFRFSRGPAWYACAPQFALEALTPPEGGRNVEFEVLYQTPSGFTPGMEGVRVTMYGEIPRSVILTRGYAVHPGIGMSYSTTDPANCRPVLDYCDTPVLPATVEFGGVARPAGDVFELDGQRGEAMVVRAYHLPVRDPACDAIASLVPELELDTDNTYLEMAVILE